MASPQGSKEAVTLNPPRGADALALIAPGQRRPPEGFAPLETGCAFPAHVGRFYIRDRDGPSPTAGAWVEASNTNRSGYAHGGYLLAFADFVLTSVVGGITINLSADFLRAAPAGGWIEAQIQVRKRTRYTIFADAIVTCEGREVARLSGLFRPLLRGDPE